MIRKQFEELKLAGHLPTPKGVGLAILRITARDDYSLHELVQAIQVDPALTGRLLMLANSALTGGLEPTASAQIAALRLGSRTVRDVALGFSLVASHRAGSCAAFDYELYWSHSIACAAAARALAIEGRKVDPADAFTCALLCRIGLLALVSVHPDVMSEILEVSVANSVDVLLRAEARAFDIQHWEVSAAMMRDWGLPDKLGRSMLMLGSRVGDEQFDDPQCLELATLLRRASAVADRLVESLPDSSDAASLRCRMAFRTSGQHGMPEDELVRACGRSAPEWQEWGRAFGLQTRDSSTWSSAALPIELRIELPSEPSSADSSAAPGSLAQSRVAEASRTAMVVGLEASVEQSVASTLISNGLRVLTASDREESLTIALEVQPDLVFFGPAADDSGGIELCRALRRLERTRGAYLVFLAKAGGEDPALAALASGTDDYIAAPVEARAVVARAKVGIRTIDLRRQAEDDRSARMRQVTEIGRLTRQLRAAMATDELTELPNRRYALLRLQEELDVSARLQRPLSIMVGDIDHFQAINDRHGQAVGDQVLQATASILRARMRRGDVVCRFAGDQFLVVGVNIDIAGSRLCAERLRLAVMSSPLHVPELHGRVTLSFGCAERGDEVDSLDGLLAAACAAVDAAKAAGRNCTKFVEARRSRAG